MRHARNAVILLTGFEPFGRHRINSSWEAVRIAAPRLGPDVVVALLPVHHRKAAAALTALLERHRPDACLLTGLASGDALRIELVARRHKALAGPDAPGRLYGTWPVTECGLALRLSGLSARVSRNAGNYVCDSTYWSLLNFRAKHGWPRSAGFLHLPPLSARFSAGQLAKGLEAVVRRRLALTASAGWETGRSGQRGSDRSQ